MGELIPAAHGLAPGSPITARSRSAGRYVVLVLGAVVMVGPFLWMIAASLKTDADIQRVPPTIVPNPFTGANYGRVVDTFPFWRFLANSLFVSLASTFLQLTHAATAAYCVARIEIRGRSFLFGLYLATMMIPLQVVIVPLFIEKRNLHLVNSYAGLLLPTILTS
jgi:multiple sugar transport system permease protein